MDERLPLPFGADVAALLGQVNTVREPVIVHDVGVVDRDVGRPPLEIVHGITTFAHDQRDQPVRVGTAPGGLSMNAVCTARQYSS